MSTRLSGITSLRGILASHSLPLVALALLSLLAALLVFVLLPELRVVVQALVAVAAVLFVLFFVGAYSEVKQGVMSRQSRYGANAVVMVLAFLGIAIIANLITSQNRARFDVTAGGQYTLARQTVTVLKGLQQPVKVTGFFNKEPIMQASQGIARNRLTEYRFQTDQLSFEFVDPDERPGVARQYEIRDYGTLVFESGDRRKQVFGLTEQDFTGAILSVTGTEQLKVYFVTGHAERDILAADEKSYQFVREGLIADNYDVSVLNLPAEQRIPDDASLLVVASPQRSWLAAELDALNAYLDGGGKALFLLDPNALPEMRDVLKRWGIEVKSGVVVDEGSFVPQDFTVPVTRGNQQLFTPITRDSAATFFPGAVGLDINVPEEDQYHVQLFAVNITSIQSFLETNPQEVAYNSGVDEVGPWPLGLVVLGNKPIGERPERPAAGVAPDPGAAAFPTRMVVFADSDFATNEFFYSLGNGDLILNTANWLTQQEELISIRPKPPEFRRLDVTQRAWTFILWTTGLLWPLGILFAGGIAWWRRR